MVNPHDQKYLEHTGEPGCEACAEMSKLREALLTPTIRLAERAHAGETVLSPADALSCYVQALAALHVGNVDPRRFAEATQRLIEMLSEAIAKLAENSAQFRTDHAQLIDPFQQALDSLMRKTNGKPEIVH